MRFGIAVLTMLVALGCAPDNAKNGAADQGGTVESMKNFDFYSQDGSYRYKAKIDVTSERKVFLTLFQAYGSGQLSHFNDYVATCDANLRCADGSYVITISDNGELFNLRDSRFGFDMNFKK